ncbi:butyrophilin-like protein 9 [Lates calcarifer]|uniref:Butyrophilin-like protein 9 n=1 Tax=Lates calcarifer TaxID=8187 RepID=A0AAJ7QM67_LATCA|nr:butyrophilin-like protein 9 [Lates calcarifer]
MCPCSCFGVCLLILYCLPVTTGAVSSPVITLVGVDRSINAVVLECESEGWYPEPEVLWLDGEGNLLSAGPTETVRGPDDLYTVSSRVTVEKRHSNSFTCRVQQNKTNQTTETEIHVPDEFFVAPLSQSWAAYVSMNAVLGLMVISAISFSVWTWSQNKTTTEVNEQLETRRVKTNSSRRNQTQVWLNTNRESERKPLTKPQTEPAEAVEVGLIGQIISPSPGQHTETNNQSRSQVISSHQLTCVSLDDGRKLENPERTPTYRGHTEKSWTNESSNPELEIEAAVLTTAPLCHPRTSTPDRQEVPTTSRAVLDQVNLSRNSVRLRKKSKEMVNIEFHTTSSKYKFPVSTKEAGNMVTFRGSDGSRFQVVEMTILQRRSPGKNLKTPWER